MDEKPICYDGQQSPLQLMKTTASSRGGEPNKGKRRSRAVAATPDALFLAAVSKMDNVSKSEIKRAQLAIERYGTLVNVLNTSKMELLEDPNLGCSRATNVTLAHQVISESAFAAIKTKPALSNFDRLIQYLLLTTGQPKREQVRMLALDIKNQVTGDERVAIGSRMFVQFSVMDAVAFAARNYAHKIILVHNHPSGDPEPSQADIDITAQICKALKLINVELLDHVITAAPRWSSFLVRGLLVGNVASLDTDA